MIWRKTENGKPVLKEVKDRIEELEAKMKHHKEKIKEFDQLAFSQRKKVRNQIHAKIRKMLHAQSQWYGLHKLHKIKIPPNPDKDNVTCPNKHYFFWRLANDSLYEEKGMSFFFGFCPFCFIYFRQEVKD